LLAQEGFASLFMHSICLQRRFKFDLNFRPFGEDSEQNCQVLNFKNLLIYLLYSNLKHPAMIEDWSSLWLPGAFTAPAPFLYLWEAQHVCHIPDLPLIHHSLLS